MIQVTTGTGVADHDADKIRVEPTGALTLLRMQRIGNYRCPLLLETVATYAPGQWSGTKILKEHDAHTGT